MVKRVLIIGGYGNFGSYIANRLSHNPNIQLIIAGRSYEKAKRLCTSLNPKHDALPFQLDITQQVEKALETIKPDIVIHTSGPFQRQNAHVAKACIANGCHYIDLADAREFVSGISSLNAAAEEKRVLIVSGASSVPCLSSCLLDHYETEFSKLTSAEYAITTAQQTNRGLATTEAVLSYAGSPFTTLIDGNLQTVYGWQDIHRHHFHELGKRFLGNCDIPDLELFQVRYPHLKTQRFYAGLEIPFIHIGLWTLTWFRRVKVLPSLDRFASMLLKISRFFDVFGSDNSAFFMRIGGQDHRGLDKNITFDLTARNGDGPYIPCMPAIILASKLAKGQIDKTGAMPCIGLLTLKEYLEALEPLDISWIVEEQLLS